MKSLKWVNVIVYKGFAMKKSYSALVSILLSSAAYCGEVVPSEIVAAHNAVRAQVGVSPIAYSPQVAASAQAWAEHLKTTNNCQMIHSGGSNGENLYWAGAWSNGSAQDIHSADPVKTWAEEKKDYNAATNECAAGKVCGHYTQLVWKNSTQVGCGMAMCSNNTQVWVCQYAPAGNWVGQKPY
jgi:pathogenesis-related protein 1